jgi:adenylate kinase
MSIGLVLLGAPGSGKGTQGERLAAMLELPRLSTGDMFREAVKQGTDLGKLVGPIMQSGGLVPDDTVVGIIRERVAREDCSVGFILDGFPRTLPQADALGGMLSEAGRSLSAVLNIVVADGVIVGRCVGRRLCSNKECGAIYHAVNQPPKVEGVCDRCGSPVIQRADDTEAAVRERLEAYHAQTSPLEGYYAERRLLMEVDGVGTPDEVFARSMVALRPVLEG